MAVTDKRDLRKNKIRLIVSNLSVRYQYLCCKMTLYFARAYCRNGRKVREEGYGL